MGKMRKTCLSVGVLGPACKILVYMYVFVLQIISNVLLVLFQPHTVVVGRAAMLLECAHLVHNCNKGQWPYWLKSNIGKNSGLLLSFIYIEAIIANEPGVKQ